MIGALAAFARERFHPLLSVPLAAAAVAGPLARGGAAAWPAARAVAVAWLALLVLRIADDLADLEVDRRHHVERGLSRGAIDPGALRRAGLAAFAALLGFAWRSAPLVLLAALAYAAYYRLRPRLPAWAGTLVLSAPFGLLPLGAVAGPVAPDDLLLAAFVFLAALGHEWGHDVHAPAERAPGFPSLSNEYGARRCAVVATLLFAAAALAGGAAWWRAAAPAGFGLALLGSGAGIAVLLARVVAHPVEARARPLYVAGMAFWALPALALLVR